MDSNGEPIIGAKVVEKETSNGTITDIDGLFSLDVQENATLIISYIGFNTQDITIGDKSNLSIEIDRRRSDS